MAEDLRWLKEVIDILDEARGQYPLYQDKGKLNELGERVKKVRPDIMEYIPTDEKLEEAKNRALFMLDMTEMNIEYNL